MTRLPPTSTLFPYTTLFRSAVLAAHPVHLENHSVRAHGHIAGSGWQRAIGRLDSPEWTVVRRGRRLGRVVPPAGRQQMGRASCRARGEVMVSPLTVY